jgi:hypothetical protein
MDKEDLLESPTAPVLSIKSFLTYGLSTSIGVDRNYETVSSKDVARRYKETASSKKIKNKKISIYGATTNPELNSFGFDYSIEVPKSGTIHRGEYLTPVYLPSKCSTSSRFLNTENGTGQNFNALLNRSSKAGADAIRSLVYCATDKSPIDSQQRVLQSHLTPLARRNSSSAIGSFSTSKPYYGLIFNSDFECGNLFKAESVFRRGASIGSPEEYNLYLQADPSLGASAHASVDGTKRQAPASSIPPTVGERDITGESTIGVATWFFIRLQNTKRRSYRFNICNLGNIFETKIDDLMRPVMISETEYETSRMGWSHVGDDICFAKNDTDSEGTNSYTLSFTIHLQHTRDTVYIALSPPYGYTQLQNLLFNICQNPSTSAHLTTQTLCRSLAGNKCEMLVITQKRDLNKLPEDGGFVVVKGGKRSDVGTRSALGSPVAAAAAAAGGGGSEQQQYRYRDSLSSATHHHCGGDSSSPRNVSQQPLSIFEEDVSPVLMQQQSRLVDEDCRDVTAALPFPSNCESVLTESTKQGAAHAASTSMKNLPNISIEMLQHNEDDLLSNKFLLKFQKKMEKEMMAMEQERMRNSRKKGIVICARTHGWATSSSWACEGIIRFLLGSSSTAEQLRRHFVFYIIPMLNPDGVVNGFSRSDLAGYDLNLCWKDCPSPVLQPAIFHAKKVVNSLRKSGLLASFIDLHENPFASAGFAMRSSLPLERIVTDHEKESVSLSENALLRSPITVNGNRINYEDMSLKFKQGESEPQKKHVAVESSAVSANSYPKFDTRTLKSTDPRALVVAIAKRCKSVNLLQCSFASQQIVCSPDSCQTASTVITYDSIIYSEKQKQRHPTWEHPIIPISLSVEMSRHAAQRDNLGIASDRLRLLTPTDYGR